MAVFGYTFRAQVDGYLNITEATQSETLRYIQDGEPDEVFTAWNQTLRSPDLPDLVYYGLVYIEIDGTTYPLVYAGSQPQEWLIGYLPGIPLQKITDAIAALPAFSFFDYDFTVCFAPGTLIATPGGARPVETLAVGDPVLTADGRVVPVRWMGRQTVATARGESVRPVRVAAGALAPGVPDRDLVLTADHALILDGLAVNAGALVNGTSIAFVPLADLPPQVTYWHVETEAHDAILANGAAAETFVDYVGRRAFDNHAEYLALYGAERIIAEMPHPRISSRRQLPAALAARLGVPGFDAAVDAEAAAWAA